MNSSTDSIGPSDSQLVEASPSFILFIKVPLLVFYCPIYATSQLPPSLILIIRQELYVHIAFMSRGIVCSGISHYFI